MTSVTKAELLDTASMKLAEVVLLLMEASEKHLAREAEELASRGGPRLLKSAPPHRTKRRLRQSASSATPMSTKTRIERYWRDARLTTIFEGTSEYNAVSSATARCRGLKAFANRECTVASWNEAS
jgi:alkylation response protein AidB-like acyl-CoA dehydrogenase